MDRLVEVRLTDPTDPVKEQVRQFGYDRLGRLRHAVNPENGTTEYLKYDARGNLLEYLDSRLNRFVRTYDAAGRLSRQSLMVGSTAQLLAENLYDQPLSFGRSAGKLTTARSYRWDGMTAQLVAEKQYVYGTLNEVCLSSQEGTNYRGLNGRLALLRTRLLPWDQELESTYCYDTQGITSQITYPNFGTSSRPESEVGYLSHNGFLWEVHDSSSNRHQQYISQILYDPHGRPTRLFRGNGLVDLTPVDVQGRPLEFEVAIPATGTYSVDLDEIPGCDGTSQGLQEIQFCGTAPGGSPSGLLEIWASGDYGYDGAGNIAAIGDDWFRYDELNRLDAARMFHNYTDTEYTLGYTYDAFGNMLQQTKTVANDPNQDIRVYNVEWQTNRLTGQTHTYGTQTTTAYGYDAAGNMISAGNRSYQFDAQGRLGQVTDNTDGQVAEYYYDSAGHRVLSVVDGIRTYFFRDDAGQVLSEFRQAVGDSAAPEWDKDYVYALGHAIAFSKNDLPARVDRPWADNVSKDGLTLHWEKVLEPDMKAYRVERVYRQTPSSSPVTEEFQFNGAVDYWTQAFPNQYIKTDTVLKYRVRALDNALNYGDWSPTFTVRPHQNAEGPPVPQYLSSAPTDRAVRLFWNPVELYDDDLRGYNVELETSPGVWTRINTVPISVTEFWHTGLVNGLSYTYRVRAVDTAGRQSAPSNTTTTTPIDNVPPARPTGLVGKPGRAAGVIELRWSPVYDHDLGGYRVLRDGANVSGTTAATSFTDSAATAGNQYCYTVLAVDSTGNESQPSDQVCLRPRHDLIGVPRLDWARFEVDQNDTTSNDGVLGSGEQVEDGCDVWQEDDDVIRVRLQWDPVGGGYDDLGEYRIYRAPTGSDDFQVIGSIGCIRRPCVYLDIEPGGHRFVYEVTQVKPLNGVSEESAVDDAPVDNTVGDDLPALGSVRNLRAYTGETLRFGTLNERSRAVILRWTRVPDPRVIGYHVYRRCDLLGDHDGVAETHRTKVQQVEFCADSWQRLTSQPVTAERVFEDRTVGGLQGFYLYAVRPVTAEGEEGPIGKILEVNLAWHGSPVVSLICTCDRETVSPYTGLFPTQPITTDLERTRVNTAQRGMGPSVGAPAAPGFARFRFRDMPVASGSGYVAGMRLTRYAELGWEYLNGNLEPVDPPSDLAGFHIEVAKSYDGPWRRITAGRLVAWWERAYRYLGVGVLRYGAQENQYDYYENNQFSGDLDCLRFRIIAVDTGGNESAPKYPDLESDDGHNSAVIPHPLPGCDRTLAAPENLRAETASLGAPPGIPCTTRLRWDPVEGAVEYVIHRYVFLGGIFFYPTQVQSASLPTFYDEQGDGNYGSSDPDHDCPTASTWYNGTGLDLFPSCGRGWLEAYYVTARDEIGGVESPPSNIVFWDCDQNPGYAMLHAPAEPEAAASVLLAQSEVGTDPAVVPTDVLAVCAVDDPGGNLDENARPVDWVPATASLLTLSGNPDPPFRIYDVHVDHLGSTRLVTDPEGDIVSEHKFLPFGEEILPMREYSTMMFTGQERDQETGFDYMMARYYGVDLPRFLSPDLLGGNTTASQSWNRYTYARNNPLGFIDPDGREIIPSSEGPRMAEVMELVVDFVAYSPDFAAEYNAHVGPDNPDLLIGTDATLEDAGTADLIWSETGEYAGTKITINPTLDFGEMIRTIAEEFGHAHDYRTNTAGAKQDVLRKSHAYEDRAKQWGAQVQQQRAQGKKAEAQRLREERRQEREKKREQKRKGTKERGTITDFNRPREIEERWVKAGI